MQQQNELNAAAATLAFHATQLRNALDFRGYSKPDISLYLSFFEYSESPYMLVAYPTKDRRHQQRFGRTFKADKASEAFDAAVAWAKELPFNIEWSPELIEKTLGIEPSAVGPVSVAAE